MADRRRYVDTKESMAYVLYDSSKTFNINEYQSRFVLDVVKINLGWSTVLGLVNGIWDVVNDSFLGALVDKTNTRWGKFRPYLMLNSTIGTALICLYWLTPLFFDKNPNNLAKIIFWLALSMLQEVVNTVRDISETGLLGSLSPSPDDRVRLYTRAEVISAIWENIPQLVIGVLMDLVNHKVVSFAMDSIYIYMGSALALASGVLSVVFAIFARERIAQASERPSYREGLRAILRNRPLLLIMVANFLDSFSATSWEHHYFIDVLGSESLRNLIMIPGAPLSFVSYGYLNKVRARFSIKPLWIFGRHIKDVMTMLIFAVGSVGGAGPGGWYRKPLPMLLLLLLRDLAYKGTLSVHKVIPKEILLDALDYGEWQNGFRSEGVTLSTKSMLEKIVRNIVNALTNLVLRQTGYNLNADFGKQPDRVKYTLFVMAMFFPAVSGLLGVIPKLFYNLTGETRQRMYDELAEMRGIRQKAYNMDTQEAEVHMV